MKKFDVSIDGVFLFCWTFKMNPATMYDDVNRLVEKIEYEIMLSFWKQFVEGKKNAKVVVTIPGVVGYNFTRELTYKGFPETEHQVQETAYELALKCRDGIIANTLCSEEFRKLEIAKD